MRKMKSLLLAVIGLLCSISVSAHDFEVEGIYYNITSETDKTVEVTYRGGKYNSYSNEYSGVVIIPESVTYNGNTYNVNSIRDYAFYGCSGLTSVVIPNSVTCIGNSAFSECSWITSVEIPNSVISIGASAFYNCARLASVKIGNSVTNIGRDAFHYCSRLTSVVIPNSVISIGNKAFYECTGLTSVVIGNSVTSIGEYAFYNCSSLTSVVIPNSVTNIGDYVFYNCYGLTSVEIPNSVTSIGMNAFRSCSSLTSVVIPNSVTSIGNSAFSECSSLTSVEIGNSVTSIGGWVFSDCRSLTSVTSYISEENVFPINADVFKYVSTNACILSVPYGAKDTYESTEGWSNFAKIVEMDLIGYNLTISDAGYATLYLGYSTEIPEGLEVYTAKEVAGNVLKMELVEDILPANTGVVVKAPAGTYTFAYSDTDAPAIADNLFMGSAENTYIDVPSNSKAFVLSKVDGEVGMYLAKLTDGRFLNNANKAYLLLDGKKLGLSDDELDTSVGGAQLSLRFNFGGATSIDNLPATVTDGNVIYDLYGRKLNSVTTPGLYIVNGKKVWVK